MAENEVNEISLKVYVDKRKNRVVYAECDEDFVDIIFSFLTTPMGIIAILARNQSQTTGIGCLLNLYSSIENTDVQHFRSEACKSMFLTPHYAASYLCKHYLKLNIYNSVASSNYLSCSKRKCLETTLSYYQEVYCNCGNPMTRELKLRESAKQGGGCFVKRMARFMISDDLQVMPLSSSVILSWFSRLGIEDRSTLQERTFNVGADEVLNLLNCSLFSKTPLTETLLKCKPAPQLVSASFHKKQSIIKEENLTDDQVGGITVKQLISKSKNMVCYEEAGKEFVSLLFGFLTVSLGHLAKRVHDLSFRGCVDHLYKCVQDLDEQFFQSDSLRKLLISPPPALGCSYTSDLLGVEEAWLSPYYFEFPVDGLSARTFPSQYSRNFPSLSVINPFSDVDGAGFLMGPTTFIVSW